MRGANYAELTLCLGLSMLAGVGCNRRPVPPTRPATAISPPIPAAAAPSISPIAAALAPATLSDLTITDIKINPAAMPTADGRRILVRGMTYTFRVEVRNVGQGPVHGAVVVATTYSCPGYGQSGNTVFVGNNLSPGETRLSGPLTVKIPPDQGGRCAFKFTVDPDNVHPESDESPASNVRELTFDVP